MLEFLNPLNTFIPLMSPSPVQASINYHKGLIASKSVIRLVCRSNTRSFQCTTQNPKNSTKPKTPECTPPECNILCNISEDVIFDARKQRNRSKMVAQSIQNMSLTLLVIEHKSMWEQEKLRNKVWSDLWKTRNIMSHNYHKELIASKSLICLVFRSNTRSFQCTTLNPKNSTKPKTPNCRPPKCNILCNISEDVI